MRNLGSRAVVCAFLVAGVTSSILANVASAHMSVTCNRNKSQIKLHWKFPCAEPPEHGRKEEIARGDPPPDPTCLTTVEYQQNPAGSGNHVIASGCCSGGEEQMYVFEVGCAKAGGNAVEAVTGQPWASVGLRSIADPIPTESMMRLNIDRIATPGPEPDIVRLWFVGGALQTQTFAADQRANATLKVIVYPDQTTADADSSLLAGDGSAFFGQATLVGALGSLIASQGFSSSDFLTVDDGGGQFTARPVAGLFKTVLVPDATAAIVSLVGDPESAPASTTGVGDDIPSGLWLGSAIPNPARGDMRIRFAIPRPGHVTLRIYDSQGRRVRELIAGSLPAGVHEAAWDGRDAAGRQVPSAAYLYRLETGRKSLTGKVLTIR